MSKYYCIKLSKTISTCVVFENKFPNILYDSTLNFESFDQLLIFLKSKDNVNKLILLKLI